MESRSEILDVTLTGLQLLQTRQTQLSDQNIPLGDLTVHHNFDIHQHRGAGFSSLSNKTDHYAMILCLSGTSNGTIDHFKFQVTPGSIHLVVPHSANTYTDISDDLHLFIVRFKMDFLEDSFFRSGMLNNLLDVCKDHAPICTLGNTAQVTIEQLFKKLEHEFLSNQVFHNQMLRLMLMELLYEVNRSSTGDRQVKETVQPNRSRQLVNQFKKLIAENYLSLRSVHEYADLLFVSAKHLSEVIKQETGLAPLHHIHNQVYKEAAYWLCNSSLSVKEIAEKLNFDTSSHFSRFFKNYSGHNPTDFQKIQCEVL